MNEEEILKYTKNIINATYIEATDIDDNGNIIEQGLVNQKVIQGLLDLYNKEKEKNSKAREFIKENSHEFNCKRDDLIELEFDYNTNATDLIDILDGNW